MYINNRFEKSIVGMQYFQRIQAKNNCIEVKLKALNLNTFSLFHTHYDKKGQELRFFMKNFVFFVIL